MDYDQKRIGQRIMYYRNKIGYSRSELADLAGLSVNQIYFIETGKRNMSIEKLFKIADALSVLVKDLVEEKNKESEFRSFIRTCSQEQVEMIKEFLDYVKWVIDEIKQ